VDRMRRAQPLSKSTIPSSDSRVTRQGRRASFQANSSTARLSKFPETLILRMVSPQRNFAVATGSQDDVDLRCRLVGQNWVAA